MFRNQFEPQKKRNLSTKNFLEENERNQQNFLTLFYVKVNTSVIKCKKYVVLNYFAIQLLFCSQTEGGRMEITSIFKNRKCMSSFCKQFHFMDSQKLRDTK